MNMHYPDPESLDEAWDCPTCGRPTPPSRDYDCGTCDMPASHHVSATELCRRLREAQKREASLIVERDDWQARYIRQNKDLGYEMMDPNLTIWGHAKKLEEEIKRLELRLEEKETFIQRVITWPHDADPFTSPDHDNDRNYP